MTSACSWHVRGTNMIMTCVWHLRAHDISAASACSSWHVCVASSCSFCHLHGICAHTKSGRHRMLATCARATTLSRHLQGIWMLAACTRQLHHARQLHGSPTCSPTARVIGVLANCSAHQHARQLLGSSSCSPTVRLTNMLANCTAHRLARQQPVSYA